MSLQFQICEIGKLNYPTLAAAKRRRRGVLYHTLRKPMTQPTKLAKENEVVLIIRLSNWSYLRYLSGQREDLPNLV